MKISYRGAGISLIMLVLSLSIFSQRLCAADPNSQDTAVKTVKKDAGAKGQIKAAKQKIAEEREGILAAGRRLNQAKRTGDKAAIEQVKKEVDAEIKERKSAISVLKSEIERLQGGTESLAPRSRGALER